MENIALRHFVYICIKQGKVTIFGAISAQNGNFQNGTASTSSANFYDLNSAAKHCFEYVKELHDHHQIQSNFTVHDRGGLRAKFKTWYKM